MWSFEELQCGSWSFTFSSDWSISCSLVLFGAKFAWFVDSYMCWAPHRELEILNCKFILASLDTFQGLNVQVKKWEQHFESSWSHVEIFFFSFLFLWKYFYMRILKSCCEWIYRGVPLEVFHLAFTCWFILFDMFTSLFLEVWPGLKTLYLVFCCDILLHKIFILYIFSNHT